MNNALKSLPFSAACITAALAVTAPSASAQETRFYVRGDLGGTWSSDTELKDFFGAVTPGSKVRFDPGARFGLTGGYQVCDWFSVEAQTGFMAANIRSITGADEVDAVYSNTPLLANARLQWPSKCPFTPYIGAGAGLSMATLAVEEIDLNGVSLEGSETDAVFGYQAFAGIRYALNDQMGISLEYRFFGNTEPSWEADNISGKIKFGRMEIHSVTAAFDYRF